MDDFCEKVPYINSVMATLRTAKKMHSEYKDNEEVVDLVLGELVEDVTPMIEEVTKNKRFMDTNPKCFKQASQEVSGCCHYAG